MNHSIFKTACCFILLSSVLFCVCTRNVQTPENRGKDGDGKNVMFVYDPQFEKEGFVTKDMYRVVIVADKGIPESEYDSVKEQAKKRSLSSLQKYIQSQNKVVSQNTTAHLLNLIDSNGNLEKQDKFSENHSVFFFDIIRSDIKRYVDSIPQRH